MNKNEENAKRYFIFLFFQMLKIRLQRKGRKNLPFYRIVVAESTKPVKGRFIEIVGHYDPVSKDVVLKTERIEHYVGNGAQPSQTVARLATKNGMTSLEKFIEKRVSTPKKDS